MRRQRDPGRPRLRDRWWARITAAVLVVFLLIVGWSVGNALTVPGGGSISTRLAEWARDHYLGALVTFGEWLTYNPPKKGGKPSFSLAAPSAAAGKPTQKPGGHGLASSFGPPPALKTFAGKPLPGEGVWRVLATVHGDPAIYGTYLRASRIYSSYVAGIASMNQNLLKFQLRPGTEDPGPGHWKAPSYLPPGTRTGLEATFNSGFKISVSGGGFYLNGVTRGTLTKGVASEVYYRNGHVLFVYGPALNVRELAELLRRAGAVTAMQLDINPEWMSYMYYRPGHHPSNPTPKNLLPDQQAPPNRYYSLNGRDFTAVYAR